MSAGLPPRKRDRMREFFRKSSSPSNPAPRSSSPLPPQTTPNATQLLSPAQNSQQPVRTILEEALLALPPKERATIERSQLSSSRDVRTAVEDAYNAAVGQKKVCEDKRWEWQFRGRTVVLRDEVDKVLVWLHRFKSIGDVVANVDPVHAGLPWAGIRVLLEV